VKPKHYILLARWVWKVGKAFFTAADFAGEYRCLSWLQRPLDWVADICMGISAKLLMKGYWEIDPDADWDG